MPALEASTAALGSEVEADEPGTSGRGAQHSRGACVSKVRRSGKLSATCTWTMDQFCSMFASVHPRTVVLVHECHT